MATKIPLQSIVVVRAGKTVVPDVGVAFDFTDAELAELAERAPGAVRDPINETGGAVEVKAKAGKTKAVEGDL